jgi:Cu(I)/Ag(I) efflux system periplasmic protein CusF
MNRITILFVCAIVAAGVTTPGYGQVPAKSLEADKSGKAGTSHTASGVVQGIDAAKGSITLEHEPVKSLNWPAMSMGFKVSDPKLLAKVKQGDKIRFTFHQSGREYVITSIQ